MKTEYIILGALGVLLAFGMTKKGGSTSGASATVTSVQMSQDVTKAPGSQVGAAVNVHYAGPAATLKIDVSLGQGMLGSTTLNVIATTGYDVTVHLSGIAPGSTGSYPIVASVSDADTGQILNSTSGGTLTVQSPAAAVEAASITSVVMSADLPPLRTIGANPVFIQPWAR